LPSYRLLPPCSDHDHDHFNDASGNDFENNNDKHSNHAVSFVNDNLSNKRNNNQIFA
jgi:hypothetical protein